MTWGLAKKINFIDDWGRYSTLCIFSDSGVWHRQVRLFLYVLLPFLLLKRKLPHFFFPVSWHCARGLFYFLTVCHTVTD
jgi:hypothetical protein